MAFEITSTAFGDGEMIPRRYTCDGENMSPPLVWTGVPQGTQKLALVCEDPDAPAGTWVHWVLFNIPAGTDGLTPEVPAEATLDNGAQHGVNGFRKLGYGGPCPPGGTHRYYFNLYALDAALELKSGITGSQLRNAMKGHVLSECRLMGTYRR